MCCDATTGNQGSAEVGDTGGGNLICDWSSAFIPVDEQIISPLSSTSHTRAVASGGSSFDTWN